MRDLNQFNAYREFMQGLMGDSGNGLFRIPSGSLVFRILASNGIGWDHVSVSIEHGGRCPTWDEMCMVKDMFFYPEDCVMQLHPPKSEYVNFHPHCLHLWRPQFIDIPRPPKEFV